MRNHAYVLLLAIYLTASGWAAGAEAASPATPPPAPATPAGGSTSTTNRPLPAEVQRLRDQYEKQRADLMDERKDAAERLRKAVTEDEKARIIEQLRQQQQQRMDQQREIARVLREQLQQLRDSGGIRAPTRR